MSFKFGISYYFCKGFEAQIMSTSSAVVWWTKKIKGVEQEIIKRKK